MVITSYRPVLLASQTIQRWMALASGKENPLDGPLPGAFAAFEPTGKEATPSTPLNAVNVGVAV